MNSAPYLTAVNHVHDTVFLGAFSKLEKVTISFVVCFSLSVCLSLHMERLGSYWTDLHEV